MCIKRGNLIGSFTFRESEAGKHVLMDYETWKGQVEWEKSQQAALLHADLLLESPRKEEEVEIARTIIKACLSRGVGELGYEDRRKG